MNHIGIFDDLNYLTLEQIEEREEIQRERERKEELAFKEHISIMVETIEEGRWKGWKPEPQFMDYVVRGMKKFLESPF